MKSGIKEVTRSRRNTKRTKGISQSVAEEGQVLQMTTIEPLTEKEVQRLMLRLVKLWKSAMRKALEAEQARGLVRILDLDEFKGDLAQDPVRGGILLC